MRLNIKLVILTMKLLGFRLPQLLFILYHIIISPMACFIKYLSNNQRTSINKIRHMCLTTATKTDSDLYFITESLIRNITET